MRQQRLTTAVTRTALLATTAFLLAPAARAQGELTLSAEAGLYQLTAAQDSADAVFGSTGGATFGGSLRYGLTRRFLVGLDVSSFGKDGERVFVASPGGTVFRLGHPLEMRLMPVVAHGAFRFRPDASLRPYLGLGAGFASYKETTEVGGVSESESRTVFTGRAFGGAEYRTGRLRLGVEAGFSMVPSAIGEGGVSAVYGESDMGGLSLVVRLGYALKE